MPTGIGFTDSPKPPGHFPFSCSYKDSFPLERGRGLFCFLKKYWMGSLFPNSLPFFYFAIQNPLTYVRVFKIFS